MGGMFVSFFLFVILFSDLNNPFSIVDTSVYIWQANNKFEAYLHLGTHVHCPVISNHMFN